MTSDDAKRALMGRQGVVEVGERGGALVVLVERDTIAIPDEFSGYRLVKEVSGKVVAGMDDATRARLEYVANNFDDVIRPEPGDVRPYDIRVLLEAYDALLAERDQLRSDCDGLASLLAAAQVVALRADAERAQAAPVLAAADAWCDAIGDDGELPGVEGAVLFDAIAGWRAARGATDGE